MRFVVSAGTLAVVPARRPTRGSGLGAAADMVMFSAGAGAAALDEALDELVEVAQADAYSEMLATVTSASAAENRR